MSPDAMEIDPVSSPGKKRKSKEKDRHSSKKRKQQDDGPPANADIKVKKDKNKHGRKDSSSAQVQDENSSPTQRSKDKHKKHRRKTSGSSSSSSPDDEDAGETTTSTRKPLSKPTGSQLASLAAESDGSSSPFHLITTSLYLPLSPISISPSHALPSLLSEHVSPLLLTYYPPVRGIILAYSNPSISSSPPNASYPSSSPHDDSTVNPQPLTPAVSAGEYGVLYVYLKLSFLVFRPERSQTLEGWINVQSESFLGAVVFNLFSVGIERRRLPADWKWVTPGQEDEQDQQSQAQGSDDDSSIDSDKENFRPLPPSVSKAGISQQLDDQDDELSTGYFQTRSGKRVRGTVRFRIRDVDVIPGSERDKGFISLEGTMLSQEEEDKLVSEERVRVEGTTGGTRKSRDARMTGALHPSPAPTNTETETPTERTGEKHKKKKTKSS